MAQHDRRDGQDMASAIRALAIDAIECADGGDPRFVLDMADAAAALWTRCHKFDAADPRWPDRDRFVLATDQGAMLLYALVHLTGHAGMGLDVLRRYRMPGSAASATPEYGDHPAIEISAGPPGQGIGTAVGFALAERLLAARFGRSLVDHRTWVIAANADLAAGLSHEAASLAGQLRLEKLTVIWHDNDAAGNPDHSGNEGSSDDPMRRFAAYGWAVKRVDGRDSVQLAAALALAMRAKKPTLIAARFDHEPHPFHACPLAAGRARLRATGWDQPPFEPPDQVVDAWQQVGCRGAAARRGWLKRLARHPLRGEFERVVAGRLPETFHDALALFKLEIPQADTARGEASQRTLAALAAAMPELIAGGLDHAAVSYPGRAVAYGGRAHGMAAAMNGLALHGGFIPFAAMPSGSADCVRPALRLAARMRQRVIQVLNSGDEDGDQQAECLATLRALPNLHVFRPADAIETAESWELALRRSDGPSVIVLSGEQGIAMRTDATENRTARGGYLLADVSSGGQRRVTIVATGPEVGLAATVRAALSAEGIHAAIVSLPCWELFAQQDESYRAQTLGSCLRVGIEAGSGFGWTRWLGESGLFIGIDGFGPSGPGADLYKQSGFTSEAIAASIRRRLA